jgi:anti-sigma factor RsiW
MKDRGHPSEQVLNMYLDEELNTGERGQVKAHLAACAVCRAELQALQQLFVALEGLEVDPTPAPDLVPGVLARVRPRRHTIGLRWLIPAIQGAAALALLAWGWTRLAGYWMAAADALPTKTLGEVWNRATEWAIAQWATLDTLPKAVWIGVQGWITHPSPFASPDFSLPQLAVAGFVLGTLAGVQRDALTAHAIQWTKDALRIRRNRNGKRQFR